MPARAARASSRPLGLTVALVTLVLAVAAAGAAVFITSSKAPTSGPAAPSHPESPAAGRVPPAGPGVAGDFPGWPSGYAGYTAALASDTYQANAIATANRARAAGLPQVGILQSGRYSSLRPGYWFVFAGTYPTAASAQTSVAAARAAGFTDAYARRVAR